LLKVFGQPTPLLAGAREAGDPIAMLPVLYHLLWRHELDTDLAGSVLGPHSLVRPARAAG
jgi:hypothetical protein